MIAPGRPIAATPRVDALTVDDVLRMLAEAQRRTTAKTRWLTDTKQSNPLTPDQSLILKSLVGHITLAAQRRARQKSADEMAFEKLIRTGQVAVNELRAALPVYIEHLQDGLQLRGAHLRAAVESAETNSDEIRVWQKTVAKGAELIRGYEEMLSGLMDLDHEDFEDRSFRRQAEGWHLAAMQIFADVHALLGGSGTSRNGPAVRFIKAALDRAGHLQATPPAIEQLLKRSNQQIASFLSSGIALRAEQIVSAAKDHN